MDDVVEFVSSKGPFVLVLMILAAWFWPGTRMERDQRQWGGIAATIAASLALAINQGIIRVWDRPRPFEAHQVVLLLKPSPTHRFRATTRRSPLRLRSRCSWHGVDLGSRRW